MKSSCFSVALQFPSPDEFEYIDAPGQIRCPMCSCRWFTHYVISEGVIAVVCHECGHKHNLSDLISDNFCQP